MSEVYPEQTAPWSPDAENLIRGAIRHTYSVKFTLERVGEGPEPLSVVVTACTVTYDEFWSPYIQGDLVAEIPDAATLAKIDPRFLVRVDVFAGYVLPGGVKDEHMMARCWVAGISIDYPANELRVSFQGAEYLFDRVVAATPQESPPSLPFGPGSWDSTVTIESALSQCSESLNFHLLSWGGGGFALADQLRNLTGWVDPGQTWVGAAGDKPMEIVREICDRIDAWMRFDEIKGFRVDPREWNLALERHSLRVGADGTIITSSRGTSRAEWANRAITRYEWTVLSTVNGVSTATVKTARGGAALTGTEYDPANVGAVTVLLERRLPSSAAQANIAAKALLRRYSVRATTLQLSAVAAYWLRPSVGVTVDLPVGEQLDLNVSAISFDLDQGRMDLRTRDPQPGNVIAL